MKIVALSDTHNKIVPVPDGDILVHAGDLTMTGTYPELHKALVWLESLPHKHKLIIAGNHDFLLEESSSIFADFPSLTYLEDELITIDGITFYGTPWTPRFGNWAFMKPRDTMEQVWSLLPDKLDVLISHGPPYMMCDRTAYGENVGCNHLRRRLLEHPVPYVFCGHIHEGYGMQTSAFGSKVYNVSVLDERYAIRNAPLTFLVDNKIPLS